MKTHPQALAVDKQETAKRGPDRSRLPVRTVNTSLPAIGETPRRTPARQRLALVDEANEPSSIPDLAEYATSVEDTDPWRWPKLPGLSRDRITELEGTVEDLRRELAARCIQIADLHNVQQQQATALLVARDAIETLQSSAVSLQATITQRENEAATERLKLQSSIQENDMLNVKIDDMETETAELLQRLLRLSTDLNDKEVAIISAHERVAELEQQLSARSAQVQSAQDQNTPEQSAQDQSAQDQSAQAETTQIEAAPDETPPAPVPVLAQAVEDAQPQSRDEADERIAQFESLLQRFESMLAAGDQQLAKLSEANAALSERCDAFTKSHAQLESQIKKLESTLAARERQINKLSETNNELSERCDELTRSNIVLEAGHKNAQEKLKSQTSDIKLLESAMRTGRETAEQKIAALTGELQRERAVHSVAERESAAIRREIALLLSKLSITPRAIQ